MLFIPWGISNTSYFINSGSDWSWMKKLEGVLAVSQRNFPWIVTAFLAACNAEDKIEIWWGVFSTFWITGYFLRFEKSFGELSKIKNTVQKISIFIINTNVIINGVIRIFLRFSGEESELSLKSSEGLFAAKFVAIFFKDEISQVQNISDRQIAWEVFDVFAEKENS